MEKLTYTFKDGVAVITMDDGKANALGTQTWQSSIKLWTWPKKKTLLSLLQAEKASCRVGSI